ncbi:MAG: hypothetical protein AAFR26_04055 [Cyanobacteria bacterium J06626_4]
MTSIDFPVTAKFSARDTVKICALGWRSPAVIPLTAHNSGRMPWSMAYIPCHHKVALNL